MTSYKLIYFNAMGRGEIPRLMFKTAGIEFEDYRIPDEQWPEFKKTIIHGHVPVLEVNGKRIIQSYALCRYIAREAGFYGKDNWESSRIDSVCECVTDYEHDVDRLWYPHETDETKAALRKRSIEVRMPKIFGILETMLKENNENGFFVGDKISMADFVVFVFVDITIKTHFPELQDVTKDSPVLAGHIARMKEIPQIKEWMRVRPKTEF